MSKRKQKKKSRPEPEWDGDADGSDATTLYNPYAAETVALTEAASSASCSSSAAAPRAASPAPANDDSCSSAGPSIGQKLYRDAAHLLFGYLSLMDLAMCATSCRGWRHLVMSYPVRRALDYLPLRNHDSTQMQAMAASPLMKHLGAMSWPPQSKSLVSLNAFCDLRTLRSLTIDVVASSAMIQELASIDALRFPASLEVLRLLVRTPKKPPADERQHVLHHLVRAIPSCRALSSLTIGTPRFDLALKYHPSNPQVDFAPLMHVESTLTELELQTLPCEPQLQVIRSLRSLQLLYLNIDVPHDMHAACRLLERDHSLLSLRTFKLNSAQLDSQTIMAMQSLPQLHRLPAKLVRLVNAHEIEPLLQGPDLSEVESLSLQFYNRAEVLTAELASALFTPLVSLGALRCADTEVESLDFLRLVPGLTRLDLWLCSDRLDETAIDCIRALSCLRALWIGESAPAVLLTAEAMTAMTPPSVWIPSLELFEAKIVD